jgi:hypothetical protein
MIAKMFSTTKRDQKRGTIYRNLKYKMSEVENTDKVTDTKRLAAMVVLCRSDLQKHFAYLQNILNRKTL